MAAEAGEQIGHRFERVQQVKRRDAAARALRLAVFFAQHEHRPVEAFHQAAGDDADHAAMPVEPGEHQRGLIVGDGHAGAFLQHQAHDLGLGLAALLIERVELRGEAGGPAPGRRSGTCE